MRLGSQDFIDGDIWMGQQKLGSGLSGEGSGGGDRVIEPG